MSEDFEVFNSEGGGEVSAEAVEKLAERLREASRAGAASVKREQGAQVVEDEVVGLMVGSLVGPGNGTMARLMAGALREGVPAVVVRAVVSLVDLSLLQELGGVDVVIFDAGVWPEVHRDRFVEWEGVLVGSLEFCVEDFREALRRNGGELPGLAGLLDWCMGRVCRHLGVGGADVVAGLLRLIEEG